MSQDRVGTGGTLRPGPFGIMNIDSGIKIVYDVGANNGDDVPYYLLKAHKVVAIEANPTLCELMRTRFAREIADGRVIVENCVVSDVPGQDEVDFYIHRDYHIWSQFPVPSPELLCQFDRRRLPSRYLIDVFRSHGTPHYVKIDVERFDGPLLSAMFAAGVRPDYVSAECTSFDIPAILVMQGGYRSFKLVDAQSVDRLYRRRRIRALDSGSFAEFSFPRHSAGPFGDDIDGPWMTPDHVVELVGIHGFGWRDLHASRIDAPDVDVGRHHGRIMRAGLARLARTTHARLRRLVP